MGPGEKELRRPRPHPLEECLRNGIYTRAIFFLESNKTNVKLLKCDPEGLG